MSSEDHQGRLSSRISTGLLASSSGGQLQQQARKRPRMAARRARQDSLGATGATHKAHGSSSSSSSHRDLFNQLQQQAHQYRSAMAINSSGPEEHQRLASRSSVTVADFRDSLEDEFRPPGTAAGYQYSSSQAQLQSLTDAPSAATFAGSATGDTLRKQSATPSSKGGQLHRHNHRAKQSRSHLSQTTKPMTSASSVMLNEACAAAAARQSSRAQRSVSIPTALHPVQPALWRAPLSGGSHPLPPPYSAEPQPYPGPVQADQAQPHVICQQPSAAVQQPASGLQTGGRVGQISAQGSSPSAASFPMLQQQQMLNFLGSHQANGFSAFNQQHILHQQQQQQQYPFLNLQQAQQQQLQDASANNGQILAGNGSSHHLHHHQLQQIAAGSKTKSCLTCADISIKWYIVVIALLGLICALIGTIVGAVHSAGRDYISLALLLIGVGLVLVAISWIALRITIKTYKSSGARASGRSPLRAPPPMATPISRLMAGQSGSSSLQRSLLNERIYMMAAAAAAAAAVSRQSAATASGQLDPGPSASGGRQGVEEGAGPTSGPSAGILSSIKGRLPKRLARLLPYSSLRDASGPDGQPLTVASGSRRVLQPPAHEPGELLAAPPNPSALAAATALFHQYQSALVPPGHPAFLFPPPPHLLGVANPEFPFRPPPPSYSASMQDQRIRMLLQERAGLHLNSMFPLPPPPPPPQAAPPATEQHPNGQAAPDGRQSGSQTCQAETVSQPNSDPNHQSVPLHTPSSSPKASTSSPPPPSALINNDLYGTTPPDAHLPAEGGSSQGFGGSAAPGAQSTSAGRAASETCLSSGSRQQPPSQTTRRASEVRILGYL